MIRRFISSIFMCGIAVTLPAQDFHLDARQKLLMAEKVITTYYVDSVPQDKMAEEAIKAMLLQLDPHSVYSDREETKELTIPLDGHFSGIGVQYNMLNDTLYILSTVAGGPSEKVGILPGDRILMAGDSIISGVGRKTSSVMGILRGEKGTKVDLTVKRAGENELLHFLVTRDEIPVESVAASFMAAPGVGYVKLTRFAENSADEIREALGRLRKQGMKSLIFDLQGNTGGYMKAAIDIAGEFLPKKSTVVSTRAPKLNQTVDYEVEHQGDYQNDNLVVLIDQFSASASEILSGAVQDYDRGVIVGRRSFGKGLVQRPFPFPDGSMIRLTIARYYTPSGRSIQKPYTPGKSDDYNDDMMKRYNSGEFLSADSVHFDPKLKTETINRKRVIYGGGGIMPDVFVPVDTASVSPLLRKIFARAILNRVALEYFDTEKDQLKNEYPTEESFMENFSVGDNLLTRVKTMCAADKITYTDEEWDKALEAVRLNIKGLLGRQLFNQSTYYRTVLVLDPVFNKGLEVISSQEIYSQALK